MVAANDPMLYRSQNVRIMIVWSAFIGVMILGGYAVYFQVLGVGQSYARSATEAQISLMLFVFGIYLLALSLYLACCPLARPIIDVCAN